MKLTTRRSVTISWRKTLMEPSLPKFPLEFLGEVNREETRVMGLELYIPVSKKRHFFKIRFLDYGSYFYAKFWVLHSN